MSQNRVKYCSGLVALAAVLLFILNTAIAERPLIEKETQHFVDEGTKEGVLNRVVSFFWQYGKSSYVPVWPVSLIFLLILTTLYS